MITKVTNSSKKINPFGGLFFVINDLKKQGIAKLIDTHLGKRVKQAKYSYSDILLNWTYCNLCGAERLEDIEKLRDSLDIKLPSHDSLGTVMKSFAVKTEIIKKEKVHQFNIHKPLNRLMIDTSLKLGLLNTKENYTLDYDNTIIYHHKYDRTKTYDKSQGYQPGVSFIDKIPVYIEGRNGNSNASFKIKETIERTFEILDEKGIKIGAFRSDSAAYNKNLMDMIHDRKSDFFIRYRKHREMIDYLEYGGVEWDTILIGGKVFDITCIDYSDILETDKPYRVVVTRYTNRKNEICYRGIITNNLKMSDKQVVYFYNKRGAIERNFDDLKNNFNWGRLPFSFLNENTVFMIISAITSIIYQYLIRKFSKKVDFVKAKHRLKNFIFHFIVCSAILNEGQLELFTDRDYSPLVE